MAETTWLTKNVHLIDDDATDLSRSSHLRCFSQNSTKQHAHDEQHAFPCIDRVDVWWSGSRIGHQVEYVMDKRGQVVLQPDSAHALTKLHVRLCGERADADLITVLW